MDSSDATTAATETATMTATETATGTVTKTATGIVAGIAAETATVTVEGPTLRADSRDGTITTNENVIVAATEVVIVMDAAMMDPAEAI